MELKKLLAVVLTWRVMLMVIVMVAVTRLPFTPTFPYSDGWLTLYGPRTLTTWAHFDGVHYLTIIREGFAKVTYTQAFFPLYPLLIRLMTHDFRTSLNLAIALSTTSFILGLYFLQKLVRLDYSKKLAQKVVLLILLFPTAFFFSAVYTEGLFFLLVVLTFYLARKQYWVLAGISGAMAAATRVTGIFLAPALLYELFIQNDKKTHALMSPKTLCALLPLSGIGAYMWYLHAQFNDPLLFFHVQSKFGVNRDTNLILLYQVFYRYLKIILTVKPISLPFFIAFQEFLAGVMGTVLSIVGFAHTRKSYMVFAILSFITPTLTGTFTSLPRYVLVLFPFFILLAKLLPEKIFRFWLTASAIMLVINLLLFTQGLFVA